MLPTGRGARDLIACFHAVEEILARHEPGPSGMGSSLNRRAAMAQLLGGDIRPVGGKAGSGELESSWAAAEGRAGAVPYFSPDGWEGWSLRGRPAIRGQMPVLGSWR